ncbi:hypothetical protein CAI21_07515 [Alkalilimnicola ehrlichii]|uniref:Uncharacterized protein n=2 Tax=Alkalilimnicola ehrlichii TaxID=351052 RepID=A0A3E0WZ03_9GAMM|nr:hypothetical protein CAI21_07515 [Alkalilimnicola ehrlichii]RFA37393.1 hypothetical protein CAL65_08850 [Alkalilimnicola ehrlichii]
MRTLIDVEGKEWDVAVGRESYGMQVLLFFPRGGGEIRKAMMGSSTRLDAQQELDSLNRQALQERLESSQPWESQDWFQNDR